MQDVDIAIFGGGIAGLWILNRLRMIGFSAVLFEREALGSGQTLASQGMIHGGQKYRRDDMRTALARMPDLWDACLGGRGELDLRGTKVLTPWQVMWAPPGFLSNLRSFVASKFTEGETDALDRSEWPEVFRQGSFDGRLYRLHERVIDVRSLLAALAKPWGTDVYAAGLEHVERDGEGIRWVEVSGAIRVRAQRYVFACGTGNEDAAEALGLGKEATQRRPLKQILVRGVPHVLYGHCIGWDTDRPRVSVTAHPLEDGTFVWYLGAGVAETGASMSDAEAITNAQRELTAIFGWVRWSDYSWAAYAIDRAEPQANQRLPVGPAIRPCGNVLLTWPSKMTMAPLLAERVVECVRREGLKPLVAPIALPLPHATLGRYPWEWVSWSHA